ncbi:MAG TPA: hypothetical protein VEC99_14345, partial [Clostridia bacterium]|nr:hypothetical protein [Clostridia bacterium]
MIPIKIQCPCGQRYSFDVEPANGRMATPIACPSCGADGTAAANEIIAQTIPAQSQVGPGSGLRLSMATTAPPAAAPLVAPMDKGPPPVPPTTATTKLAWYEHVWIALPFALVAVGGAIGGACGGAAW